MVKFGTKTLPGTILEPVEEHVRKIYEEKPIPGKPFASRKIHGGFGEEYVVRGLVTENLVTERAELKALADGVSRGFDLEDGSPLVYALMVDPSFRMESGKLLYELTFAKTSFAEVRTLSDSPSITDVLSGVLGGTRSLSDTPSISELLKAFKSGAGTEYGFGTIGSQNYPTIEEGVTTTGSPTTIGSANTWFTKITIANPCTVKQLHIYIATAVGNKRLAIYDNAQPNNLLGQTAIFVGSSGAWAEIDLIAAAHAANSGAFFIGVTELDGNAENYHYVTGVTGDGYQTPTSYVTGGFPSTLNIAALTSSNLKLCKHTKAVKIKGYIKRGSKFTLPGQKEIWAVKLYSYVAVGNARVAVFDEQTPKNKKWESGSVALAAGPNVILISSGTPSSLILPGADYGVWWQYDNTADAPSYTQGSAGDGRYLVQAYGAFPSTISGDVSTDEKWTETMVELVWEEV